MVIVPEMLLTSKIKLVKKSGEEFKDIKANVQSKEIVVFDEKLPFEEGDKIIRELSNGNVEEYLILDVGFQESPQPKMIPHHFQIKVKKITKNKMEPKSMLDEEYQLESYILLKKIRDYPKPVMIFNRKELSIELGLSEDKVFSIAHNLCMGKGYICMGTVDTDGKHDIQSMEINEEGKEYLASKRNEVEDYIIKTVENYDHPTKKLNPKDVAKEMHVPEQDVRKFIKSMDEEGFIQIDRTVASGEMFLVSTALGRKRIEGVQRKTPMRINQKIQKHYYGPVFEGNKEVIFSQTVNIEQFNQDVDQVVNQITKDIKKDKSIENKKETISKIKQLSHHSKEIYKIIKSFKDNKIIGSAYNIIKKIIGMP